MQTLAREMMLEYLGYEVAERESVEIDAVELCAALGWACAVVVSVACEGTTTLQQIASESNSRGVALVCALCDKGEDTLEAAGALLDGADLVAVCYELMGLAGEIARRAKPRREDARQALELALR
jgi:Fe2+ transport system protein B